MSEVNENNISSEEVEEEDQKGEGEEEDAEAADSNNKNQVQKTENEEEDENTEIEVEVEDRGMNTDELPPEELQRLVDNNKELQEINDVSNIDHEVKEPVSLSKKELIEELNEKDKIFELLVKSNNELKNKIEISNKKYQDILNKIETKKSEDIERKLNLQIKEIEKEIKANNSETDRYKKMIDQLKTKIEFKENLERVSSIQYILKQETLKNKDLQNELSALKRINKVQNKYIANYNKENQIQEKLDMLDNEIQGNKVAIKEYQEKHTKLERFIRLAHEKILSLEMLLKKVKEPKNENKKLFTKEELKDTLELITNLQSQINDKRNQLNNITKESDIKMHKLLAQNKQIELEYKENEKLNKMLINKKNELKRSIKNVNSKTINSIKFPKTIKYNISSIPKAENNNIKDDDFEKDLFKKDEKENENNNDILGTENTEAPEGGETKEKKKGKKKKKKKEGDEENNNIENNTEEAKENKEGDEGEKKVEENKEEQKEKKKKKKKDKDKNNDENNEKENEENKENAQNDENKETEGEEKKEKKKKKKKDKDKEENKEKEGNGEINTEENKEVKNESENKEENNEENKEEKKEKKKKKKKNKSENQENTEEKQDNEVKETESKEQEKVEEKVENTEKKEKKKGKKSRKKEENNS